MMNTPANLRVQINLTILLSCAILLSGVIFQKRYDDKKIKTRQALQAYYEARTHRPVDPADLSIWTTLAVCRYGIEKVECEYIDQDRKLS